MGNTGRQNTAVLAHLHLRGDGEAGEPTVLAVVHLVVVDRAEEIAAASCRSTEAAHTATWEAAASSEQTRSPVEVSETSGVKEVGDVLEARAAARVRGTNTHARTWGC